MLVGMSTGGTVIEPRSDNVGRGPSSGVRELVLAMCPFLAGEEGGRAAQPSREQRCGAVAPAALLTLDKQRRLCLTDEHRQCATYLAAHAALSDGFVADAPDGGRETTGAPARTGAIPINDGHGHADRHSLRWALPSTAPVVLERGRSAVGATWLRERRAPQLGLATLMVAAFVVLVVARLTGSPVVSPAPRDAGAVGSPSAAIVALASTSPAAPSPESPTPAPIDTPTPGSSAVVASPSVGPTPIPTLPSTSRTYTVRSGDTVGAIAARFGTTVKAIVAANHLADARVIHVGQVLIIP